MKRRFRISPLLLLIALVASSKGYAQDRFPLRYGTTSSIHNLPVWVAKSAGLLAKYGLDVEVILVRGGTLNIMGIIADRLQLSSVGTEAVVGARAQGADVALLACAADADLVYVIKRPEIKSPADLKGKASAVTRLGGTTHYYLRVGLRLIGLDADKDITVLQLGRSTDVAAALERGQIAVAALPYAYALPLLEKDWPVLVELSKAGIKYPPACVVSTRAYIKKNPKLVENFLKAYVEAIYRIKQDNRLGEDVYMQFTRETNRELVKKVIRVYSETFKRVPYASDEGIETVLSDQATRSPIPKELFGHPEYFRDNGPLEKIEKSGFVDRVYQRQ
jgi:sulfonate transport system substrate-binding protein